MTNKTPNEKAEENALPSAEKRKHRHPYTTEHSKEEMFRRMRGFPERAAKFLEKLNADREKNPR